MGESELDQALVERVKNGDKRAFDLLVRKYQHKIVSVVTRYVSDWSEAQDVAQEAFIRAYRAMGAFRGDSAFYTWIYKIAINTAKNYLVSRGRRPPIGVQATAPWLDQLIARFQAEAVANPPRRILRYRYRGQTVYYVPPSCCDQPGILYDETGTQVCAPDGGISGRGDGRCPDFHEQRSAESLIWSDSRSR